MKAGLFFKRLKRKIKGGTLSGDEPLNLRKTLKRFVETGFFHIFGGTVINKIIAFLTSVVLVRILTAEEYGVFTYAWNIYSMLLLLDGVGMASAVLQICSERSTEEAYMRAVGHYGLKCGALFDLLLAVVLFAIGTWAPLSISGARGALQLLSGLPIFHFLFDVISNYLRAEKRNRDYAALKTFNTAVIFAVSMLGTWVLREKGLILGYYAAYILTLCVCLLRRDVGLLLPAERPEKSVRRAFWGIAVVSMCNTALSQLLYLLDIFVLGVVDPQETVLASYRVATIIPTALNFIPVALITYVYPYFAEHRMDGRWCLDRYKKMLIGLGAFNLITGCVLIAGAPFFVRLIFGETYSDVTPIFRLLIVNYCISGTLRVPAGNLLVTQRKLKFNLFVAILSGLVNIAADFLFISWWGAMGAALATVLVVIITSVMNVSYLMYTFKSVSGKEG